MGGDHIYLVDILGTTKAMLVGRDHPERGTSNLKLYTDLLLEWVDFFQLSNFMIG